MHPKNPATEIVLESISELICMIAVFCFLGIGFLLHSQIIKTAKREKDITWKLDITNSCCVMIHYLQYVSMYVITYVTENLYIYTGEWVCYLSKFLTYYGGLYVQGHSLIISLLKYVVIVHWKRSRQFGKDKIKRIFFWLNMFHPVAMFILHLVIVPDFFWIWDGYSHVDRCLGDPENNWVPNSNSTQTKLHNLCMDIAANPPEKLFDYFIYASRSSICWLQVSISYLILWNVFEIFVYFAIFRFMHRQIQPSENNVPGNCLSDSANELNRKKLLVNAEVTAVTTLIELIGGITFVIHLYLIKGHSFSTLFHAVAVKCAIMPYAFLMNTSHNKNRIIERGWKNIFKNILKPSSFPVETVETSPEVNKENSIKSNKQKDTGLSQPSDIFTVSTSENRIESSTFKESSKELPSCSEDKGIQNETTSDRLSNHVFPKLDVKKLGQQKYIECMSYKLIYNLDKSLENEKIYIESFQKLLHFMECCKKGNILSEKELEDEFLSSYSRNKEFSKKKSKRKGSKHSSKITSSPVDKNHGQRNSFLEDGCIRDPYNSIMNEEKNSRWMKRVEILHELQLSCKENEKFNLLLDQLIDMEECFISESAKK